jgi:hypothetical protein
MPDTTPSTPKVDLLTRILAVDLSTPRNLNFQPVPEGHIVLGTISENAQKAFCLGFDVIKEISKIEEEILAADEVHNALHDTGENTAEICDQHRQAMNELEARIAELRPLQRAMENLIATMVALELEEAGKDIPNAVMFNEGFVVSIPPEPTFAELFEQFSNKLSELKTRMSSEEPEGDEGLAAEEPAADAQAENSEALSEETPTDQPTNNEELVTPEKS